MDLEIKVLKTNEIDDELWIKITKGFNICFNTDHAPDHFKEYYKSNCLGFSYHAIALTPDGVLIGYNSFSPTPYRDTLCQKDFWVGVSGGTYVLPEFRKEFMLACDLGGALQKECAKDGMVCSLGVSNQNSFQYAIKLMRAQYLGDLQYWMLPLRPFKIIKKPALSGLDTAIRHVCRGYLAFMNLFSKIVNTKETNARFELAIDETFYDYRFYNKDRYEFFESKNTKGVYRICEEDNLKAAYIMDFRESKERTLRSLTEIIRDIVKKHPEVDAVLFIGRLKMIQNLMIKVPHKYDPHQLPLTIGIKNTSNPLEKKEAMLQFDNWNFSLVNFDAR